MDEDSYIEYVKENKLRPLEPLIKQANMDLNQYVPNLIVGIEDISADQLYGLPIEYEVPYLIYNKEAFQENNVPFPKDGMTCGMKFLH